MNQDCRILTGTDRFVASARCSVSAGVFLPRHHRRILGTDIYPSHYNPPSLTEQRARSHSYVPDPPHKCELPHIAGRFVQPVFLSFLLCFRRSIPAVAIRAKFPREPHSLAEQADSRIVIVQPGRGLGPGFGGKRLELALPLLFSSSRRPR